MPVPAFAERYLTVDEVLRLAFPKATAFEAGVALFNPEERARLEERIGEKVRIRGNRYWLAKNESGVLGVLVVDHVIGKHEFIDYAVALDPGGTILRIEVLEYRESYGYEIRGEKWRGQFEGKKSGDRLRLHDTIHNISGATLSCRHVTEGVRRVLATYELVLRPRLRGRDRLPEPAGDNDDDGTSAGP